jgi:hypothetical protein
MRRRRQRKLLESDWRLVERRRHQRNQRDKIRRGRLKRERRRSPERPGSGEERDQ